MAVPQELVTKPPLRTGHSQEGGVGATLRLTIVFHPDLQRIGRWTDLCVCGIIDGLRQKKLGSFKQANGAVSPAGTFNALGHSLCFGGLRRR